MATFNAWRVLLFVTLCVGTVADLQRKPFDNSSYARHFNVMRGYDIYWNIVIPNVTVRGPLLELAIKVCVLEPDWGHEGLWSSPSVPVSSCCPLGE